MVNIFEENKVHLTPMKSIRLKCLECCGWSSNEVKLCSSIACPLFRYRNGHRPKVGKTINIEKGKLLMKKTYS